MPSPAEELARYLIGGVALAEAAGELDELHLPAVLLGDGPLDEVELQAVDEAGGGLRRLGAGRHPPASVARAQFDPVGVAEASSGSMVELEMMHMPASRSAAEVLGD